MKTFLPPFMSFILLLSVSFNFNLQRTTGNGEKFSNTILSGFYPDPSICRVGNDDYYLVNSSFVSFHGLPIFHSKDLVHWEHISDVVNRPEQLDLDSAGVLRGLFAPTIRYYKGVFYVTCTLRDKCGNFVVTAKNPAGP